MRKVLILSIVWLSSFCCYAQTATITSLKDGELSFPIVHLKDSAVSKKINDILQAKILDQTSLKKKGTSIFDECKWTQEKESGLDEISYSVILNDQKLLCINIYTDYLSARLNPSSDYFCFNVQNGEPIIINDILTSNGIVYFGKKLRAKRASLIKQYSADLIKDNEEDAATISSVTKSLRACNESADTNAFLITKKGIIFYKFDCDMRADFPDSMDITYSMKELWPYLTDFGKNIFTDSVKNIKDQFFPSIMKPLTGTINNKYAITMQLIFYSDNRIGGYYYYNSKGKCIRLDGQINKDQLTLTSEGRSEQFKGIIKGTSIEGTWQDLSKNISYPFSVSSQK